MESRFIQTNGITMHVLDYGGDGPDLILAHGLSANARFFDGILGAGRLTEHARVIVPDLRGRGLSDKPDSGYTMEDHTADMLGLIEALDLGPVIMGGQSFGGLVTYHLAAYHPDVAQRCVALDAPIDVDPSVVDQIKPSLARLEMTLPSFDAYLAAVRRQPYFEGWWDPAVEAYYRADVEDLEDGSVKPRSHPSHIQQAVEGTLTPDWSGLVGRIHQPTLIVRARDPFGPPGSPPILGADQAERLIDALPDGRLVEIEGNHLTAFFGGGAARVSAAIVDFVGEQM